MQASDASKPRCALYLQAAARAIKARRREAATVTAVAAREAAASTHVYRRDIFTEAETAGTMTAAQTDTGAGKETGAGADADAGADTGRDTWSVDDPASWALDQDGLMTMRDGCKIDPFFVSRADAEAGAVAAATSAAPLASDAPARAGVVRRALALVPDSRGALTVEDLLPYFPDFTVIDEFKEAVLEELGRYSPAA
jgi:hypothetical protein